MVQSYVIEKPEELNEIDNLGDDFFIFVLDHRWIRYYIIPSGIFKDTYNVYGNRNSYETCCNSIVDAVQYCFNQLK